MYHTQTRYRLTQADLLSMALKYQQQLSTIPGCPASECEGRAALGYRYVKSEDLTGSFAPVLAIKPERALKWSDLDRCGGWALSFFASLATARANFLALQKNNPKIHKTLGNAVAEGQLQPSHGLCSPVDADGHFELHEFDGAALAQQFTVVDTLA